MLRPTFLSFETAKRAINVSQLGLDTVGHNIANVSTPGYTRQRVDQVSLGASGMNSKFRIYGMNGQSAGQGVLFNGISQIRDPYLDVRYRNEAANYGELAIKSGGLNDLQDVLDEIATDGLSAELEEFINELTKHSSAASDEEYATVVRNAAQQLTQMLNKSASELSNVLTQQKSDLSIAIENDVNATIKQIAYLNDKIRQEHMVGNPALELQDDRNMLIDTLAEYANIKVVNTPEKISDDLTISRLSIVMVDNSTAPASEFTLVDNNKYNTLRSRENADGTVEIDLIEGGTDSVLKSGITDNITKGAIRGYLDLINGKGDFAGKNENAFRGVPYYQKALDVFAQTFAQTMNSINSITVADQLASGGNISVYENKNLFTASDGTTTKVDPSSGVTYSSITAANITISGMWEKELSHLTITKLPLSTQEPKQVQDEFGNDVYDDQGNPVYESTKQNENLNAFVTALKGTLYFTGYTTDGDSFTLFRGGASEFLTNTESILGLDQSLNTTKLKASDSVIGTLADSRDAISAVSADEEAVNMMIYQNYYNAALRYMTTIDEALGMVIQNMGVVGR